MAKKSIFTSADGGLRPGWLLAASLGCYALVALGTRVGLGAAFRALFDAWGVNDATAALAPGWARTVYSWHGSLITLLSGLAALGACVFLRRLWGHGGAKWLRPRPRPLFFAALTGLALAILVAALGLIPDSLRLQWVLSAPRLHWALLPLCAIGLIGALAEEAFTKAVLYDGIAPRWGRLWATLAAVAVFFVTSGGYAGNWVSALNVMLMGALCCLAHERLGLWAATGLRWGWSFANGFLLGFGGGDYAVYRLFGVSEALLTGGDAGPIYGLWTTAAIVGAGALLWFRTNKTDRSRQ